MQSLERLGPFFPGGRIGFLLVHGLAGTPAEMKILGKRLNRYGFTVLCPQLAGHCASEEELITTCWSDWSRSVEDAFDALSRHMDAVFVGGLSAGAVLSLRHAQRYPGRARGLALYSTTLRYDGWTIPKLSFLLPLILDDALVRFDDRRMKSALALLREEAKTRQIILFTCQTREQTALNNMKV